jgi:Holliday junction resolvase RusA-like endonuclease
MSQDDQHLRGLRASGLCLALSVYGTPAPQGSRRYFRNGGSKEMSKKVGPWREAVKDACFGPSLTGALAMELILYMPRGTTVKRARPSTTPDIDKVIRCTLDGLTEGGAWKDDGQVVDLHAEQFYADDCRSGASILIWEI